MKVELKPGEKISVTLEGTDGIIDVEFGETAVTINADLPDSSGRVGEIYREDFGTPPIDNDIVKRHDCGVHEKEPCEECHVDSILLEYDCTDPNGSETVRRLCGLCAEDLKTNGWKVTDAD